MKDEFVKKFTKSIKEADYSELRNIVAEGLQKVSDSLATDSWVCQEKCVDDIL